MTLKQLVYFREVVKYKNFTKAANALYTSQSALSHAIMELEDELGVELFVRTTGKKINVSAYGLVFLDYAERILADVDKATDCIREMRAPTSGVVNIAYSFINGFELIPRAIKQLNEDENGRNIITRVYVNHGERKIEDELRDGKIDLAFTTARHFLDLCSEPIYIQSLCVMIPISNPLAQKEHVTVQDIANESIIIYHRGRHLHRWILKMFEREGLEANCVGFYEDWAHQMTAVALGEGIVITPPLPHDSQLVKQVALDHPMGKRCIYMHWREKNNVNPAVSYSIDFYHDYFEKLNGGPIVLPDYGEGQEEL